jgi:hypothetical protein
MTTKWRIFRRALDTSLAKSSNIITVAMMLHNYVIDNDGLVMNNLATTDRGRFGVDPLPPRENLDEDNNGFIPHELAAPPLNLPGSANRRQAILQEMIDCELRRPQDNIHRNG